MGEAAHLLLVARPVGEVGEVGEVDEALAGKLAAQLAQDGQPTDTGIEHPDGADVAHLVPEDSSRTPRLPGGLEVQRHEHDVALLAADAEVAAQHALLDETGGPV